ncbi:MAG: hypothetical protein Tsb0034_18040 [Ekhidna sp.]
MDYSVKCLFKIFLSLLFIAVCQIGFAGTITTPGTDGKKPTEKDQLAQQNQQQEGHYLDGENKEVESDSIGEAIGYADQDSLENDSVSKYNFIFYFLYKFKYDQQGGV